MAKIEFIEPNKETAKEHTDKLIKLLEWHQDRCVMIEMELMKIGMPYAFIPSEMELR